jgi:predicted cupin superfamily sugar epimerase
VKPTPQEIIDVLKLEPLPIEGGYFRRTYESSSEISAVSWTGTKIQKPLSTSIFYLLTPSRCRSKLHKLPSDEIYHFYLGSPVHMLLLLPDGTSQNILLGSDLLENQHIQFTVPANTWQGSLLLDRSAYALMGTTMSPGYVNDDFILGDLNNLLEQYPQESNLIKKLLT